MEEIHVSVSAYDDGSPERFLWSLDMSIGEAAKRAARRLGLFHHNPTLRVRGRELDRTQTLAEANFDDGSTAVLVTVTR